MPDLSWLGISLALASAVTWGGGDFSGGVAARRATQFQVVALAASSGLALLILCALLLREPLPSLADALWAGAAGAGGAIGIAVLYHGLSLGNAASVAPATAVISATVPVIYGAVTVGWPGPVQLAGLAVALAGLWLVSQSGASGGAPGNARAAMGLALLAGLGFGGFFILIGQVRPGLVFTPLVVARAVALLMALLMLGARRQPIPGLRANPVALLAGVLDAGGNIFYVLAQNYIRLDLAAVIGSLYPASTVLLAAVLLKERVSRRQWLGAALCLLAIVLIAA